MGVDDRIYTVLDRLQRSKFRSSFRLSDKDILYIREKSIEKIREHAYDFVNKRIRDGRLVNDGKQTPMRGHPVFVAQHARDTCCRGCIEKWHHISKGIVLSDREVNYIVEVIMAWIDNNMKRCYK